MTDERKRTEEEPPRRNERPIRTTEIPSGQTEKRSRYCGHGNVWGRRPKGC